VIATISGSRVFRGLDRNDELRNDWEDLCTTFFKHIESALSGKESVWLLLLTNAFEEDWKVVMVVKGHDVDFPKELVGGTVVNCNWEITSVVEASEFGGWNWTSSGGSGLRLGNGSLLFGLSERR